MTQQEMEILIQPYKEAFNWTLIARSGNGNATDDTYLYHFVDNVNVSITINPVNKGFSFSKNVDFLFKLKSDEFTPLDCRDHFEKNYFRFRKIVIQKQLN